MTKCLPCSKSFFLVFVFFLIGTINSFGADIEIWSENEKLVAVNAGLKYPVFVVAEGEAVIGLSENQRFDTIYIDGVEKKTTSSYWYSTNLDLTPYCNGKLHLVRLNTGGNNWYCYIIDQQPVVRNGMVYSIIGNEAFLLKPQFTAEEVILDSICVKDGITYPVSTKILNFGVLDSSENLINLTINAPLTQIAASAFSKCSKLEKVNIPGSVTDIGDKAFQGCISLKTLILEDGESEINIGVDYKSSNSSYIGRGLFSDCPLENIYLGRNLSYQSSQACGYSPFYGLSKLTNVAIGEKVTVLPENVFYSCIGLKSIIVPSNVQTIQDKAFTDCINLSELIIEESAFPLMIGHGFFDDSMFKNSNLEGINLGRNLSYSTYSVSQAPFYGQSNLTTVEIGSMVTDIPKYLFSKCKKLIECVLPSSLSEIGKGSFEGCESLSTITVPTSVKSIGDYAFDNCVGLKTLIIEDGDTLLAIGCSESPKGMFGTSALERVYLGRNLSYVDGPSGYKFPPFYKTETLKEISIGPYVTEIGSSCFSGCIGLTEISLPSSLITVSPSAFSGCISLKKVVLEDGEDDLGFMGDGVFGNCPIETLYIGRGYTVFNGTSYPFGLKESLISVSFGDMVTFVNKQAFYGCSNLVDVKFSSNLSSILSYAFSGCKALTTLEFPMTLIRIEEYAFKDCDGLKAIDCLSEQPPMLEENTFEETAYGAVTVQVPIGCVKLYRENPIWKHFYIKSFGIEVKELILDPTVVVASEGESFQINATILPEDATDKTLEWSSSDDEIATVDETGLVSVLKEGNCVITARTTDGSDLTAACHISITTGMEEILFDSTATVDVFTLDGVKIKSDCKRNNLDDLTSGIYLLRKGNKVEKLIIH